MSWDRRVICPVSGGTRIRVTRLTRIVADLDTFHARDNLLKKYSLNELRTKLLIQYQQFIKQNQSKQILNVGSCLKEDKQYRNFQLQLCTEKLSYFSSKSNEPHKQNAWMMSYYSTLK
jgi:hypothetical protein